MIFKYLILEGLIKLSGFNFPVIVEEQIAESISLIERLSFLLLMQAHLKINQKMIVRSCT